MSVTHRSRTGTRRLVALLLAIAGAAPLPAQVVRGVQAYTNARWFDGTTFRLGDRYVADGVFLVERPARVDSTIDLGGAFVVPPFGEAHSHNVESTRIESVTRLHLDRGVFYVKNPNSLARYTTPLSGRINIPGGVDAIFANGGLTSNGGHPVGIAQRQIRQGSWTEADGEGGFYWIIDSRADLDAKWPRILADRPDFIKTYLLYSEQYERRRADSLFRDWRGLDPALLPDIVARAHAEGLRVSTHVESAHDFRVAVNAGVNEINHLPGFRPDRDDPSSYGDLTRYALTDDDAKRAARAGITVVTTIGGVLELLAAIPDTSARAPLARRTRDMLRENLRRLHRQGVLIAIGSDEYSRSADFEAAHLEQLGAVDNLTLLKWWTENTPVAIFPSRRLGKLAPGYEASFLVLGGNPVEDFANTRKITLRVKQGLVLPTPSAVAG